MPVGYAQMVRWGLSGDGEDIKAFIFLTPADISSGF